MAGALFWYESNGHREDGIDDDTVPTMGEDARAKRMRLETEGSRHQEPPLDGGSSRSKISAPLGFSAPARVPPPGFSSGCGDFQHQQESLLLNFSSGFPSQDGLNPPLGVSSGISSQGVSKNPPRLPSPFSSGFSSQDGPNPSYRSFTAFASGLSSQDGASPTF